MGLRVGRSSLFGNGDKSPTGLEGQKTVSYRVLFFELLLLFSLPLALPYRTRRVRHQDTRPESGDTVVGIKGVGVGRPPFRSFQVTDGPETCPEVPIRGTGGGVEGILVSGSPGT